MTTNKWTPGEWKVTNEGDIVSDNGDFVGYTMSGIEERMEADATVMSASKNLYAALKSVEWSATKVIYYELEYGFCPACLEHRDKGHAADCKLNAALKKAEG